MSKLSKTMAAASFGEMKQGQYFSKWLMLFQYLIQYYLNRKFLSIKLSRNTAKLDFMVHLKSSMEAFFKNIVFEKRNFQVLHISIDLKVKQS